jgi:hypothetical protein
MKTTSIKASQVSDTSQKVDVRKLLKAHLTPVMFFLMYL